MKKIWNAEWMWLISPFTAEGEKYYYRNTAEKYNIMNITHEPKPQSYIFIHLLTHYGPHDSEREVHKAENGHHEADGGDWQRGGGVAGPRHSVHNCEHTAQGHWKDGRGQDNIPHPEKLLTDSKNW